MCRVETLRRALCIGVLGAASAFAQTPQVLVTNNQDPGGGEGRNSVSFFRIGKNGALTAAKQVLTNGATPGGFTNAGIRTVLAVAQSTDVCIFAGEGNNRYVHNVTPGDVAAVDAATLKSTGKFLAGANDLGDFIGVGLASNGQYLYAGFSASGTIATYQILSGCKLQYLKSVPATGTGRITRRPGGPAGMAVSGNMLVVTYEDGSISSFNISKGVPVSNGDLQNSTGSLGDLVIPQGVDITSDGKFAIFASSGSGVTPVVEVSEISGGKLTRTSEYSLRGSISNNSFAVELSPDESLLYVLNLPGDKFTPSTVAAAFFDKATGAVSFGCEAGSNQQNSYLAGGLALSNNAQGTGGQVYVGGGQGDDVEETEIISIFNVQSDGKTCSLTEAANSPVQNSSSALAWPTIVTWPPRAF